MLDAKVINIETTNLCQSHCIMCPREKFTQKLMHMDYDLFTKIVDDAHSLGYHTVSLCFFGDPLLDPHLERRCEYIKNISDMYIYISTTCNALRDPMIPWLCELIDEVKISHFATTKDIFEKVHKNLSFEKAYANIMKLVEHRKAYNKPYLNALFIKNELNAHQQDEWVARWEPLFDEVNVWTPHNWTGNFNYRKKTEQRKTCGRPFNGDFNVGVDGRVTICCFDYNKTITLGDMNTQTIEEVRNNSVLLKKIGEIHSSCAFTNCGLICEHCCQTFVGYDDVLVYSSNKERCVGMDATRKIIYSDISKDLK